MGLYLPTYKASDGSRKQSKVYWMEFRFHGQEIRESTGTRSINLAKKIMDKRRRDLEEGAWGIRQRPQPKLLSVAGQDYLEIKAATLAPSSLKIEKLNLNLHLVPVLGRLLISDIEARDITKYQQTRLSEGAAPSSVNLELATLRAILRRHGLWARLQPDVRMLRTRDDVGRAITPVEEQALLQACSLSWSPSLLPFVTLALDTGARFGVIKNLRWENIDFVERCLKFGKDKTPSGTGRIVPLNPRACTTLQFWASQFPVRKPEHFVFPYQQVGGGGKKEVFGFTKGVSYDLDPTRPFGEIKEAWEKARLRAARILKGIPDNSDEEVEPLRCRFHDLRHTAVSRMLDAGVPLMKVAKIVGWSPSTMVQMAARYGHFTLDELRGAVESIHRPEGKVLQTGTLQNTPVLLGRV
jgi:integrase